MKMQRATNVAVLTACKEPLRGILEIDCVNSAAAFEVNEELAHQLCAALERFLTQVPHRTPVVRFA